MNPTRPQRLSVWVVSHLPRVLVADTERVGLSLAFIAVGSQSLINASRTVAVNGVPLTSILMWSISLIIGGIFTIWGMSTGQRTVERFGLVLSAWGCATYGVTVLNVTDNRSGWIVGCMFILLCVIKLLRLVISTASGVLVRKSHHSEG